ncbi:MAG: hypothetical protein ACTS5I_00045, partial [Rhodanobacter sp.]
LTPASFDRGGMAIRDSVSIDDTIAFLNELIAIDPDAIAHLCVKRVPCNEALSDHPTVQVAPEQHGYSVGVLGIINGLFGVDGIGWGPIMQVIEDGVTVRFQRTRQQT